MECHRDLITAQMSLFLENNIGILKCDFTKNSAAVQVHIVLVSYKRKPRVIFGVSNELLILSP